MNNEAFEIEFTNRNPINGNTKFGGQPDWYDIPQWPIGKTSGKLMKFVCQIKLSDIGLNDDVAKYAYFFISDNEGLDETWLCDGGDNAIILQPGNYVGDVQNIAEGPTLYKMVEKLLFKKLREKSYCSSVTLTSIKDSSEDYKNKLLGTPEFLQFEEYPSNNPENWDLLFQIDSTNVPFYINFGGSGVGYGFINKKRTEAKFIWQQ